MVEEWVMVVMMHRQLHAVMMRRGEMINRLSRQSNEKSTSREYILYIMSMTRLFGEKTCDQAIRDNTRLRFE